MKKNTRLSKTHTKIKSHHGGAPHDNSLIIDMSQLNQLDETGPLTHKNNYSFVSPTNSLVRHAASKSLAGPLQNPTTTSSKKSSRTKEFLNPDFAKRKAAKSSDSEFEKGFAGEVLKRQFDQQFRNLYQEIAMLRDSQTKQIDEVKGSLVKMEFRFDELVISNSEKLGRYKRDIKELKERLTAIETDLTYWNLKEYHQPKQIYVVDAENLKSILKEDPTGANFITRVLKTNEPPISQSLYVPPQDPKEYLNTCDPQDLSILKQPHYNNNGTNRDVIEPHQNLSQEEKEEKVSGVGEPIELANNYPLIKVEEPPSQNNPHKLSDKDLDASLLKALDLTANFPISKNKERLISKNRSVANLTLPDFLKAPVSISEKFVQTTKRIKFINHLNEEFHSERDQNTSLPLFEQDYHKQEESKQSEPSLAHKAKQSMPMAKTISRAASKDMSHYGRRHAQVNQNRKSGRGKLQRLHSCEIKLDIGLERMDTRKSAADRNRIVSFNNAKENRISYPNVNIIKERGQRVSYLKFNPRGEHVKTVGETPTSISSAKDLRIGGERDFKSAFKFQKSAGIKKI